MPERRLRVAVDARCLNTEHVRGMGKSLYELIRRTSASGAIEWHLFGDRPDRPFHAPDGNCHVDASEMRGYRFSSWEQLALPRAARRVAADLLHAPATSLPWWQPVPTAVTIHDTIPWQTDTDPHWPPGFYRDRLLPSAYHRASAIMTISNTSRRDILARWPALEPKLHLISPGVDERYLEAEPDRRPFALGDRELSGPYLLYVGGSDPRKRLMWALQAWWTSASARLASFVVCGVEAAAQDGFRRAVPRELQQRLIFAPFVAEDDMPRLYMRAAAVLYPSLYEGFGLPVIEAHAVGTPVLFSEVGSLSELQGPAAVVLPVDELPAWSAALDGIVQSNPPRPRPDRIARAWAQQYSWDAYADRTLAVYQSIVSHQPVARSTGRISHREAS
jgi:glycosyltransferase involved in cell wall biosynthesis